MRDEVGHVGVAWDAQRVLGEVVHRAFRALTYTRDEDEPAARKRQKVLTERAVEEANEHQQAAPKTGRGDHRAVSERKVERVAISAPLQEQQDRESGHDLGGLDPRERAERRDDQQQ